MSGFPIPTLAIGVLVTVATPLTRPTPPTVIRRPAADSITARLDRELGTFIRDEVAAGRFSGVAVVARHGTPIFSRAAGEADEATHRPNTLETRFNLGSANKMFTAVAIAQLVDQGRVALDSPFVRYLPDYPNQSIARMVTVRQLLFHTSGMGSYFNEAFIAHHENVRSVSDLLPYFVNDSLQFQPGSRFGYSNSGFVVLGLIIERVSGESYAGYERRHVFEPAGMTHTDFGPTTPGANHAIGYASPPGPDGRPRPGPRVPNTAMIEVVGSPAGGAYSTAHDMLAFSRALWSGKLIPMSLVDTFTTGKAQMGAMMYGLGFGVMRRGGTRIVGHNGGGPGINAEYDMYPDSGYDVVVLSNCDPPAATMVIKRIRDILAPSTGG